jgi:hypothetical protein
MTTINQKDADQDQLIALLTHRIEDSEKMAEELRDRVRKLERWVWGAGAIISAAVTIIGIALAAESKPAHAFTDNSLTGAPCATTLSNSFVTEVAVKPTGEINGSNDTTKQEVLLQLQSN